MFECLSTEKEGAIIISNDIYHTKRCDSHLIAARVAKNSLCLNDQQL